MTYLTAKRAIDILIALALLILLSPLMFGLYIAVSLTSVNGGVKTYQMAV